MELSFFEFDSVRCQFPCFVMAFFVFCHFNKVAKEDTLCRFDFISASRVNFVYYNEANSAKGWVGAYQLDAADMNALEVRTFISLQ